MLETKGVTVAIMNHAIAANPMILYNGMKRSEVLTALKTGLVALVNTHPLTYTYDTHGDKHFPGGPAGTKFTGTKLQVNPLLVALITPELGRIRRDANGSAQTYYLSSTPMMYTNGQQLAIQVDYVPGPPETITYHGYPRAVTGYVLSRALGGAPIGA
ncbi:MAG: hypothetical protein WA324_04340 [Bryobacteraceae bacterium]